VAGLVVLGIALAAVSAAHHALVYATGERLLEPAVQPPARTIAKSLGEVVTTGNQVIAGDPICPVIRRCNRCILQDR
jgi:hypothetical protein